MDKSGKMEVYSNNLNKQNAPSLN